MSHVPGTFRDYFGKDSKCEKNADSIMGMIPSTDRLAKLIGGLGIGNNDQVCHAGSLSSEF